MWNISIINCLQNFNHYIPMAWSGQFSTKILPTYKISILINLHFKRSFLQTDETKYQPTFIASILNVKNLKNNCYTKISLIMKWLTINIILTIMNQLLNEFTKILKPMPYFQYQLSGHFIRSDLTAGLHCKYINIPNRWNCNSAKNYWIIFFLTTVSEMKAMWSHNFINTNLYFLALKTVLDTLLISISLSRDFVAFDYFSQAFQQDME